MRWTSIVFRLPFGRKNALITAKCFQMSAFFFSKNVMNVENIVRQSHMSWMHELTTKRCTKMCNIFFCHFIVWRPSLPASLFRSVTKALFTSMKKNTTKLQSFKRCSQKRSLFCFCFWFGVKNKCQSTMTNALQNQGGQSKEILSIIRIPKLDKFVIFIFDIFLERLLILLHIFFGDPASAERKTNLVFYQQLKLSPTITTTTTTP